MLESHNDGYAKALIIKSRTSNKCSGFREKSKSKSKSRKNKCIECHEVRHFRKQCSKWKDKGKKKENLLYK